MYATTKCNTPFECVQWDGNNIAEIVSFCKYTYCAFNNIFFRNRFANIKLIIGDYLCKINNDFFILSEEQFDKIAFKCISVAP